MLRKLMLAKKLSEKQKAMEELRSALSDIEKREEELATAIDEANTDEELQVVNDEIDKIEKEKKENAENSKKLEDEIAEIEKEQSELDEKEKEAEEQDEKEEITEEKREKEEVYHVRTKNFGGMTREQVENIVKREDVKNFLTRTRELKGETRAVKGAELGIPEVLLDVLRDNIHQYSKLISKINLRKVRGTARAIVAGNIPEAVWTEACAKLNELDINFNEIEIDGYKVGGFIAICNATLEDATDIGLYNEIMTMLAQAIGLALDKAILYGTGKKMPLGIVTRLAQKAQPDDYSVKARKWVDLSTTNIKQVAGTKAEELIANLLVEASNAKANYSTGKKFWAMNEATYTLLQSKLITFNSNGALVSAINNTMPILNGDIVILPFLAEGDIIGGYGDLYVLAERSGMSLASSDQVQFIEENTVFKASARYDGKPTIAEGFVALNIAGKAPTTTMTFAEDKANAAKVAEA